MKKTGYIKNDDTYLIETKKGEKRKVLEKITKKEIDEMRPDIRVDTSQDMKIMLL